MRVENIAKGVRMVEFNPEVKKVAGAGLTGAGGVNGTPEDPSGIEVFAPVEDDTPQVSIKPNYKNYQYDGVAIGQSLYDIANVKQFMFHSNKNAYSQLSDINQNNVFYAVNSFNTAAKDSQKGILEYLNDKKGFDPKELSKIIDSMLKMADANGIHKLSGDYIYLKSFSEECANSTKVTSGKAAQADESMVMLMRRMNDSLKLVDDKDITRMTDILVRKNVTGALGTGYNWQELQERQGKS